MVGFKARNQDFNQILRSKINQYFDSNHISKKANTAMFVKIGFYVGMLVVSYTAVLLSNTLLTGLLSWALLGLSVALAALNICHDAIHGSLSSKPILNSMFSNLFNVLGANDYVWKHSHNMAHHTFTNILDHDEDMDAIPFVRTCDQMEIKKYHRFQHLYAFFIYGLATISWVFVKDYVKYSKGQVGQIKITWKRKETMKLIGYKMLYYVLFLVIPFLVIDLSWTAILGGFFLMHFVEGFTIAVVFMLAHLVEAVGFPTPDANDKINSDWAEHQLITTSNFATQSRWVTFLVGGLNFQVEHHLFPDICHIHYPAIQKIVKENAEEYHLPYNDQPSIFSAIGSHIRFLKKMGKA